MWVARPATALMNAVDHSDLHQCVTSVAIAGSPPVGDDMVACHRFGRNGEWLSTRAMGNFQGGEKGMSVGSVSLLEQPDALPGLGMRARARIEATFSWPRIAEATAAVYAEILAERRGRPARITTSASEGARRAIASTA